MIRDANLTKCSGSNKYELTLSIPLLRQLGWLPLEPRRVGENDSSRGKKDKIAVKLICYPFGGRLIVYNNKAPEGKETIIIEKRKGNVEKDFIMRRLALNNKLKRPRKTERHVQEKKNGWEKQFEESGGNKKIKRIYLSLKRNDPSIRFFGKRISEKERKRLLKEIEKNFNF